MNHNLLVGQSGGPTAVINGSLYGVVSEGLANPEIDNVIGMVNGLEGFCRSHNRHGTFKRKWRTGTYPHHTGFISWVLPL